MWNDPIVDEVRGRGLRLRRSAKKISRGSIARALNVQKNAGAKLVSRPGTAKLTMPEIDREIATYRKEKVFSGLAKIYAF